MNTYMVETYYHQCSAGKLSYKSATNSFVADEDITSQNNLTPTPSSWLLRELLKIYTTDQCCTVSEPHHRPLLHCELAAPQTSAVL